MSLETTVFTFKISVPFEEWAAVYDSEENIQMNKERGIICIYKGVKFYLNEDILLHQYSLN